jgi:hypothetical protein
MKICKCFGQEFIQSNLDLHLAFINVSSTHTIFSLQNNDFSEITKELIITLRIISFLGKNEEDCVVTFDSDGQHD